MLTAFNIKQRATEKSTSPSLTWWNFREYFYRLQAWKGLRIHTVLYFLKMFTEVDIFHYCCNSCHLKQYNNRHTEVSVQSQKENKTKVRQNIANFEIRRHLYKYLFLRKKNPKFFQVKNNLTKTYKLN